MDKSTNFGFYLPSRDVEDFADINKISENFKTIDNKMAEKEKLEALSKSFESSVTGLSKRVESLEKDGNTKPVMIVENEVDNATISIEEGLSHLIYAIGQNVSFSFAGTGGVARQYDVNFFTSQRFDNLKFVQEVQWNTVAPVFKPDTQYRIIATCADPNNMPNSFYCSWYERTKKAGEIATVDFVGSAVDEIKTELKKVENSIGDIETAVDSIIAIQEALIGGGV